MQKKLEKIVSHCARSLSTLRTGRAHPGVLDALPVVAYGGVTPLKHVASITVEDASMLLLTLYDRSLLPNVEKAIREASLNPISAGHVLRVPVPKLTQEHRHELVKRVRLEAEQARVAIRGVRREHNEALKAALKEKSLSEDAVRRQEEQVQKLTNQAVEKIDHLMREKETELLQL